MIAGYNPSPNFSGADVEAAILAVGRVWKKRGLYFTPALLVNAVHTSLHGCMRRKNDRAAYETITRKFRRMKRSNQVRVQEHGDFQGDGQIFKFV